jgi:chemotaxis protein methyltransferase CheR
MNALTTNLTSFFREGHHFDHLRDILVKHMNDQSSDKKIRIWSSACSSGPEPYSISMVLDDVLKSSKQPFDAKILATDIDSNMIEIANNGIYKSKIYKEIPKVYSSKYIGKSPPCNEDSDIEMPSKLKKYITFKTLNLLRKWPMHGLFDVIFCRNVVIYFNKDTQKQLFDNMADILHPGGILYIGHSETLHGVSDRFELIGKTVYKKIK